MNSYAGMSVMRWPLFIGPLPQPNPIGWFRVGLADDSSISPSPAFFFSMKGKA